MSIDKGGLLEQVFITSLLISVFICLAVVLSLSDVFLYSA